MGMYQGVNASEGIGIGTVMVAVDPDLTFEPHEVADSAAEKERYQTALSVFCEKTQAQADHMKETVGEAEAEIMSGHIVLAQDPCTTDASNAAIDGGTCAEQALMDTSTMFENMFLSMDDEMFRLRAADIADIRTGILAELLGKEVVDLSVLPENTVVVVHDLTPSMTATIDKAHVASCRYVLLCDPPDIAHTAVPEWWPVRRFHRSRPPDSGRPVRPCSPPPAAPRCATV